MRCFLPHLIQKVRHIICHKLAVFYVTPVVFCESEQLSSVYQISWPLCVRPAVFCVSNQHYMCVSNQLSSVYQIRIVCVCQTSCPPYIRPAVLCVSDQLSSVTLKRQVKCELLMEWVGQVSSVTLKTTGHMYTINGMGGPGVLCDT